MAIGSTVSPAWEAASLLSKRGIKALVVNARFVKPLDSETITNLARSVGRVITVEENVRSGGFGQQVRDALHEAGLGAIPHTLIALPDEFVEHGSQPILRAQVGIDAAGIEKAALELLASVER